ncbi:MAG: hypothetical protein HQL25_03565 [Candidatus Omnitrophica bacterium]|nr:hypothetical protein [Candidatus Omnitrophota bacterium]
MFRIISQHRNKRGDQGIALFSKRGQILASEYVVIFSVVTGMIIMMTVFVKRAFQARIYDARNTMVEQARANAGDSYIGTINAEYEPYYMQSKRFSDSTTNSQEQILPGGTDGTYIKSTFDYSNEKKNVIYLPPKDAK